MPSIDIETKPYTLSEMDQLPPAELLEVVSQLANADQEKWGFTYVEREGKVVRLLITDEEKMNPASNSDAHERAKSLLMAVVA